MIHVILLDGPADIVAKAEALLQHAPGFAILKPGVWLVSGHVTAKDWRDLLTSHIGAGLLSTVLRCQGSWASSGFPEQTRWLKDSDGSF